MKIRLCGLMLCLFVFSSSLMAQPQITHKEHKPMFMKSLEKLTRANSLNHRLMKSSFTDPELEKIEIYNWDEDETEWNINFRYNYTWESGNLLEYETQTWDGSEWVDDYHITYEYSGYLVVSETIQYYDESIGGFHPIERYLYSYVGIANMIFLTEVRTQEWTSVNGIVGWNDLYKDTFIYDGTVLTGGLYSEFDGFNWIEISSYSTSDTEAGAEVIYSDWNGTSWVNTYKELYPGKTAREVFDFFMDVSIGYNTEWALLKFDFPDYSEQVYEGGVWVNSEQQVTHDFNIGATSDLLYREVLFMIADGNEWITDTRKEVWYNGNANPDSAKLYFLFEDDSYLFSKENYIYLENDLMAEVVVQYNNGEMMENALRTIYFWEGQTTGNEKEDQPVSFSLNPAYPNPFNPATTVSYSLNKPGTVDLKIYDMLGRYIATIDNGMKHAGNHAVRFDAATLASGIYLIRLESAGQIATQRVTLVK